MNNNALILYVQNETTILETFVNIFTKSIRVFFTKVKKHAAFVKREDFCCYIPHKMRGGGLSLFPCPKLHSHQFISHLIFSRPMIQFQRKFVERTYI